MTSKILRHRYKIISELGKGGFGTTYLAVDLDLPDRPQCVVKQLTPSDPRPQVFQVAKKLFDKEAKILHRLGKHEQIPQLFAYFEEGGQFYLVQEFIEGNDLTNEIYPGKKISEKQAIQLLTEILSVLRYVHQQNVIHRDLKPQNIMRRKSDGKIVLIDFGAVKEIKGLTVIRGGQTSITIAVGTPGYMPIEQAAGQPKFCSDIYAVGMITIEALTGVDVNHFPKDSSTGEIIWKNRVNVSDDLGRVLEKMVLYDWRDRYQSIDEVIAEIRVGNYSANATIYPTTMPPRKPVNNPSTTIVGSTVVPNIRNSPQIKPPPSNNLSLVSASGIDYTKLRDLLVAGKWKEANKETNIVMKKAAQVGWFGGLNSKNIKKIPCQDLQIVDQLWIKYSNGHFGLSVQKEIYLDTGNLPLKYNKKTYKRFGEEVGWKLKQNRGLIGGWLYSLNIIFERNAPRGHLPVLAPRSLEKVENLLIFAFFTLLALVASYVSYYIFRGDCFELRSFIMMSFASPFLPIPLPIPPPCESWYENYYKNDIWWLNWLSFKMHLLSGLWGYSIWIWFDKRKLSSSHYLICTLSKKLDEHHNI
ncbi:MAG: protein kinase [Okeania sp. SIO3B5]|uniref:serine/threonine-protein kinase n=1 Tax=Okeania sp. SIO3B5 TaxID=2607811 RepID=UPI001401A024|nr:serine/threonine-protein kinase [Okeania sp. SIO3B5]NEO54185.1 protein kinase [Okeania sp. SIO3B5]